RAPRGSIRTRGVLNVNTTSCAGRRRNAVRTTTATERPPRRASLVRELSGEFYPLSMRRELLVRTPVVPRILRLTAFLQRHRQIEMRVRVDRVQPQRIAIAGLRFAVTPEVVKDVSQVEVAFEDIWFERDRSLVQRLRLGDLVSRIVDVREVDDRRHQI